ALYITDTTMNPNSHAGDWQCGAVPPTPIPPNVVCGTWKSETKSGSTFMVAGDPPPNVPNTTPTLGPGSDLFPPLPAPCVGDPSQTCSIERYATETRWNVASLTAAGVLQPGHSYRLQFIVHDGDQNKAGGDVGEGCVNVTVGE